MLGWLLGILKFLFRLVVGGKEEKALARGEYETIIVDRSLGDGVVKLIFNRPKKKNAFNKTMYKEISAALDELSSDDNVKACIVTGSGDFYSSGNDLANFSVIMHPLTMAKEARATCDMFVSAFINFRKPLIAVVNGPAIGIAATTLGMFDRIFACDRTYFKTPFAELGQSPEGCSSFVFPKIMGDEMAYDVLWRSKKLTAEEAVAANFVHEICPADKIEEAAVQYAKYLVGFVDNKDIPSLHWPVREQLVEHLQEVNQQELDILEKKWVSKECFLALASFLESRNLRLAAMILRVANMTGSLWGQPSTSTDKSD